MISIVDNNTVALLSLALDAAGMRQQAIAHNIANANAPGYRALTVSFESHLADARQALEAGRPVSPASYAGVRPTIEYVQPNEIGDDKVSIDTEVAKMSETVLHQQALLKALNRHLSLLNLAINEGKR